MYAKIATGPTSFAPMIETAIGIVDSTGGQYHVLLIIADGQVCHHFLLFYPFSLFLVFLSNCDQQKFFLFKSYFYSG